MDLKLQSEKKKKDFNTKYNHCKPRELAYTNTKGYFGRIYTDSDFKYWGYAEVKFKDTIFV